MTTDTKRKSVRKQGTVVSNKMDKTLTVRVDRVVQHPLYKKYIKRKTTIHVHDERNEGLEGDVVEVEFTRPMSKLKRWRLVEIVRRRGGETTKSGGDA